MQSTEHITIIYYIRSMNYAFNYDMVVSETLKHAHGNYTDSTVQRCGRMAGNIGNALDTAFHEHVCNTTEDSSYRSKNDYDSDIRQFVNEYRDDKLFSFIPGRQHRSFPKYQRMTDIREPSKLKQHLNKFSRKLDRLRMEYTSNNNS